MNNCWTREQAERELEAWRASKQSMEAFERERGAPAHRLRYRIKRVSSRHSRAHSAQRVPCCPFNLALGIIAAEGGSITITLTYAGWRKPLPIALRRQDRLGDEPRYRELR
jgi:hypothetical protein